MTNHHPKKIEAPLSKKFTLLYIPYLISALGLCAGYTFLNWFLLIELELFSLKDFIVNFILPAAIPWIPILLYLRPRIKLLNLQRKRGSWNDFYMFILWFALAVPIIVAQIYLEKASGKLTELQTIDQITKEKPTKYYTLKKSYIDKINIGVHPSFDVSGKYSEYFNMHLYIALPIVSKAEDTSQVSSVAWLGIEYSEQISNRLEANEKDAAYAKFSEQAQNDFDRENFDQFVYLERIGNTDKGDGLREAMKVSSKYNANHTAIFQGIHEPYAERTGNTFIWIFITFAIGAFIFLILILIPKIDEYEFRRFGKGEKDKSMELKEFINFIKPKEGFFITPILMYINIGVYLIMVFDGLGFISFKASDLLAWGANYRPLVEQGEYWRLITAAFLHGGIMHVLANMYGLLFVGIFLEPKLGRTRYLIVYLLSAVLASCASIWWYEATVCVGASGAIFGLYGTFLALLLTKVFAPDFAKAFLYSTVIYIAFNLVMGLTGGIDNAAHVGGLVSGFLFGIILSKRLKTESGSADIY